jgi:WD40 repeat protein
MASDPPVSRSRRLLECIAFMLASAAFFAALWWWFATPAHRTFHGHTDAVSAVVFSPDGKYLVSGSNDTTVRIWAVDGSSPATTIAHNSGIVTALAISPGGNMLAVATDENETVTLDAAGRISSISHTGDRTGPHAHLLAFPSGDLKALLRGHTAGVTLVGFFADGSRVVTHGHDHKIKFWDPGTGAERRDLKGGASHSRPLVAFSPDGKFVAVGDEGDVKIVERDSAEELRVLKGDPNGMNCLTFSPDGRLVAAGGSDQVVRVWAVADGELLATLSGHLNWVNVVQFSPDGQLLAAGSRERPPWVPNFWGANGRLTFWGVRSYAELGRRSAHPNGINSIAFSPDGNLTATGGNDGTIKLWKAPGRD